VLAAQPSVLTRHSQGGQTTLHAIRSQQAHLAVHVYELVHVLSRQLTRAS
jgi:hypothetical protein